MVAVFASFIINGDPTVKEFGVGLASAILIAGTMVCVLLPAVMLLTGRHTWWLPRWLDRVVPDISIEGPKPSHAGETSHAGEPSPEPHPA
jgi:RND superfamily putative drug exporter